MMGQRGIAIIINITINHSYWQKCMQ